MSYQDYPVESDLEHDDDDEPKVVVSPPGSYPHPDRWQINYGDDFQVAAVNAKVLAVHIGIGLELLCKARNERDDLRAEVERLEADNELGRTDAQALRESLASARAEGKRLRATLGFIAGQQPCKPDYWSACPQCEHNVTICEDALEPTNTKGGD